MVSQIWGKHISGPVLAFLAIVLPIIAGFITDARIVAKFLNLAAIATGLLAVLLILVAQYEVWRLERDTGEKKWREEHEKYEAEFAKNAKPELRGRAHTFVRQGFYGTGSDHGIEHASSGFKFRLDICNYRPTPTNFKQLHLGWANKSVTFSDVKCETAEPLELHQGMGRTLTVSGTVLVEEVDNSRTVRLELDGLTVVAIDGFGVSHTMEVEKGAVLALRPS